MTIWRMILSYHLYRNPYLLALRFRNFYKLESERSFLVILSTPTVIEPGTLAVINLPLVVQIIIRNSLTFKDHYQRIKSIYPLYLLCKPFINTFIIIIIANCGETLMLFLYTLWMYLIPVIMINMYIHTCTQFI